jgi:hypothetical protein
MKQLVQLIIHLRFGIHRPAHLRTQRIDNAPTAA